MLKLIKYELRKTWFTKVILLAVTAVAEAAFLIGLWGNLEDVMATGALVLGFLAVGGVIFMGVESILTLHRDMNTRQAYMLFMTPNSCYKILGAKVLECGASILLAGAFYFALGALDITLILAKSGQLNRLWGILQEFLTHFTIDGRPIRIEAATLAAVTFVLLSAWISLVTTAYLADVISAALLNGKRYNGFVSFLFFILISLLTDWITRTVTGSIHDSVPLMAAQGCINLGFSALMYVITARIMETRLSV